MGYRNAADILPENLLEAIQAYIEGEVVYIPKTTPRKDWGEGNGSQGYYRRRNLEIRALLKESEVLILDEPSNHLDQNSIHILKKYISQTSKTVILISHDPSLSDIVDRSIQV